MIPELARALEQNSAYDDLPAALKQYYTPTAYAWLTDGQKASLERDNCEPSTFED